MPYFDETTGPSQAPSNELKASAYHEALILSSRNDSLGALIRAQNMTESQRLVAQLTQGQLKALTDFLYAKSAQADKIISDALTSESEVYSIRRKARNVQRRLLTALLCKHAGYTLEDLKGAKYGFLVNLANHKGILNRF